MLQKTSTVAFDPKRLGIGRGFPPMSSSVMPDRSTVEPMGGGGCGARAEAAMGSCPTWVMTA